VHCGHEATARAFAFAKGVGISLYGLDDRGAEARADRHARASAAAQAAIAIRIAPCPRCHRRDRRAVLEVYRSTLLLCLAIRRRSERGKNRHSNWRNSREVRSAACHRGGDARRGDHRVAPSYSVRKTWLFRPLYRTLIFTVSRTITDGAPVG